MNRNTARGIHSLLLLLTIFFIIALSILFQRADTGAAETEKNQKQQTEASAPTSFGEKHTAAEALPDIEMVLIRGGCFMMGDVFGDGSKDERPVHEVCLDDYYIGKYEVTQAQWSAVMGSNPSEFKDCGGACPVDYVSWHDIQRFIEKLHEKTERRYRLPTEAEWEYAARSGGKGAKWSGTNDHTELAEYAWFAVNAGKMSHPAGQKKPNSLGIYDMSGNVSEWVRDLYDQTYYRQSPKEHPKGPATGAHRVLRGGNFFDNARQLRTTHRDEYSPSHRISCVGFRLSRTP